MHPVAACSLLLALHLQSGSRVVQHSMFEDRVAWVLPPDRYAAFARGGVVMTEDVKTHIVGVATVSTSERGIITLDGSIDKTTQDVPRHHTDRNLTSVKATVTPRNQPLPGRVLDLEEAPMTDLPASHVCVGSKWRSRLPVKTTLGSGVATIDHTIASFNGHLIEVDIKGAGVINGLEYNLPRLLPGSIAISGKAWYDPMSGAVTQESYLVHNRLIRTVNKKTIGFKETETVDVTTHVERSNEVSRAGPAPHR